MVRCGRLTLAFSVAAPLVSDAVKLHDDSGRWPFGGLGGGFGFGRPNALAAAEKAKAEKAKHASNALTMQTHLSGPRAKDVRDIDVPGCQRSFPSPDQDDVQYSCIFRLGEVYPPFVNPAAGLMETYYEGDTITIETNQRTEGLPMPWAMIMPKELPTIKMHCPMCGGVCDTSIKTTSPELYDLYMNKIKPAMQAMAKAAGLPGPAPRQHNDTHIQLPPCPLVANLSAASSAMPSQSQASPGLAAPDPGMLANWITQMYGGITTSTDRKTSISRANGTTVMQIHETTRWGHV